MSWSLVIFLSHIFAGDFGLIHISREKGFDVLSELTEYDLVAGADHNVPEAEGTHGRVFQSSRAIGLWSSCLGGFLFGTRGCPEKH